MQLSKKVALITGAARGIGEAIAETLAEYGAHCILVSRKTEGLEKVAAKIVAADGKAEVYACHMGYTDQIQGLFEKIGEKYGRLDILINNAGWTRFIPHSELAELSEEVLDNTWSVIVKAPIYCTRAAVPHLRKNGAGAVINITSSAAYTAMGSSIIYCAAKAALAEIGQGPLAE